MKLLNIGCGGNRPKDDHWVNLDNLKSQLQEGTPERMHLDEEPNYVDHDLSNKSLPFPENTFDGILCSHVLEHFDCHTASKILFSCREVLKPGGLLVVSVPDAEYFLSVYSQDKPEKAVELFGEPICPAEPWHKSFFDYALFYWQHRQLYTSGVLTCQFLRAGFIHHNIINLKAQVMYYANRTITHPSYPVILPTMNRLKFSLEMCAVK